MERAERGDRAGEAEWRQLLERVVGPAPFGFALYSDDHRYLMINSTLAALNGRPPEGHLGRTVHEVVPELATAIAGYLDQVVATGEPLIDVEVAGETPGEPGRRGIWLNSFYRVTAPDGRQVGVAALALDVTEQRRLQQQLATEQFRAAFDATLEAVIMASATSAPDGRTELWIDYLNPAAVATTELQPADAVGRRLTDLFPVVAELGLDDAYRRVLETGVPFVATGLRHRNPQVEGGQEVRFDISVSRTPSGLLITWRDSGLEHRLAEQQAALAAERTRVAQLQRSFLPRQLPSVPGISLAARYRSADRDAALGGDWYDALVLGDQVVVCVGDVAGHGMAAVEIMGVARITARAYLVEDTRPESVLARLDRFAVTLAPGAGLHPLVTMVAATYDRTTRRFRWSNAGHPPPVLVEGGSARVLPGPAHAPIGAGRGPFEASEVELAPGATVVLYTDGLVERRGECLDTGIDRLLAAAVDLPVDAYAASQLLLDRCVDRSQHDDVCVLVLRVE